MTVRKLASAKKGGSPQGEPSLASILAASSKGSQSQGEQNCAKEDNPVWHKMPDESFLYAKVTKAEKWAWVRASRSGGRAIKLTDWVRAALNAVAKAQGCDPDDWTPRDQVHDEREDSRWNR